jgi:hypothetical protein
MGMKYQPTVKDQKAQARFQQAQKQKLPPAAKKPADTAKRRAK